MSEWVLTKPKIKYNKDDDIKTKLAKIRGVRDLDRFLTPSSEDLHDPYLLRNITGVAIKILSAMKNGLNISVFADIDSDGVCSAGIVFNYLRQFYDKITYFHAQRSMGHGIESALDLVPENTDLLIIVDSSTSSESACSELHLTRGIEIVIVDHHPKERDNLFAMIVNPQLDDYPNKSISGAGLCFKLIQVLDDTIGSDTANDFIDLAGIGLYGDMMDVSVPENRYILYEALNNIKNKGICAILKAKNKDPKWDTINTGDIGFTIAPMLNAAARLDKIELALELLTSDDEQRCKALVKEITKLNEQRKKMQAESVERLLREQGVNDTDKIAVFNAKSIGKGFGGLVAQDISQYIQKPVVMLAKDSDGNWSGSFRSYNGFDLKKYLGKLPQVIMTAGHAGAGGVTVKDGEVEQFIKSANEGLKNTDFGKRTIYYDIEVDANEIDEQFIRDVMEFTRVSGQGMYEVKFRVKNLFVSDVSVIGKTRNTVKVDCGNLVAMKFRTDEQYAEDLPVFEEVDIVGSLQLNSYYNFGKKCRVTTNQIFIEDAIPSLDK